jgi:N-acetylmuramoyl-L-alanine amidase
MDEDGDAEANFTQKQWDTLDSLVDVMTKIYPNAAVVGHNDLDQNKSCPVFEVSEWMSQVKEIRTS